MTHRKPRPVGRVDRRIRALVAVAAVASFGCGGDADDAAGNTSEAEADRPASSNVDTGVANPAAEFCEQRGGKVFGPEPMCGLPDGSTVDAWEYFREETTGSAAPPSTTSEAEPESTTTTTPATTTVSTTTTSVVESPTVTEIAGEPFQESFPTIAELPELPASVTGYVPIGGVQRDLVRVFDHVDEMATPYLMPSQGNRCEYGFWVARWTSADPDVLVYAANDVYLGLGGNYEVEEWLLPPPAPAGIMGGYACTTPGFVWADNLSETGNLIDVAVEWQYYERDFFDAGDDEPTADVPVCPEYTYDSELPISVCSEGFSVQLFQEALGLNADGYFGPGTEAAVREYQASAGLPITGEIDAITWAALGVTANAPYPDLNGDGVVDGSEFPFD